VEFTNVTIMGLSNYYYRQVLDLSLLVYTRTAVPSPACPRLTVALPFASKPVPREDRQEQGGWY
jgi:hypothetical protein